MYREIKRPISSSNTLVILLLPAFHEAENDGDTKILSSSPFYEVENDAILF